MKSGAFDKFIQFGSFGTKKEREQLANNIFNHLQNNTGNPQEISSEELKNYTSAIDDVLENDMLREICKADEELAEKITENILEFANKTHKQIQKSNNPYEKETEILKEFSQSSKKDFPSLWQKSKNWLQENYSKEEIDTDFYTSNFKSLFFEDVWNTFENSQITETQIIEDSEKLLIEKFAKILPRDNQFYPNWKKSQDLIAKKYRRKQIDCNSFFGQFQQAMKTEGNQKYDTFNKVKESFLEQWQKARAERISEEENLKKLEKNWKESIAKKTEKTREEKFVATKEHLAETWQKLLTQQKIQWELDLIDEQRKKFCEELYKKIEDLKKIQHVLQSFTNELGRLWDMSSGRWQKVNFDILKKYAELLQKDESVKNLVEMLGKMKQAEKEYEEEVFADIALKPEWKIEYASKADLIGIYESDDLSSLLPSEVALLADENTENLFFQKYAEKKLQTFEYQAKILSQKEEEFQNSRRKEKENKKGPFIICVDTSGSMHGTPETVAKTLCFAILKTAIRERRKCYLISFSTSIETLNLTDFNESLEKIINFLSMSFHGGTDASPAMKEALVMLENKDFKTADVVLVSDFVMPKFETAIGNKIRNAKLKGTKFHSLIIGDSKNQDLMVDFDNHWFYDTKSSDNVLTLVKSLKTIR